LLCDGLTHDEIGARLGIATRTVEQHVVLLRTETGRPSTLTAVVRVVRLGLVKPGDYATNRSTSSSRPAIRKVGRVLVSPFAGADLIEAGRFRWQPQEPWGPVCGCVLENGGQRTMTTSCMRFGSCLAV